MVGGYRRRPPNLSVLELYQDSITTLRVVVEDLFFITFNNLV